MLSRPVLLRSHLRHLPSPRSSVTSNLGAYLRSPTLTHQPFRHEILVPRERVGEVRWNGLPGDDLDPAPVLLTPLVGAQHRAVVHSVEDEGSRLVKVYRGKQPAG